MPNKFVERFNASHDAVEHTVKWLKSLGVKNIRVPKSKLAPSHSQWKKYTDDGDLFVGSKRLEVKGMMAKQYWFTAWHEFPYTNWTVCAKHSYDRANPKPYAYLMWNNKRTHVAIIKTDTYKWWKTIEIKDPNYPTAQELYVVSPTLVEVKHFAF